MGKVANFIAVDGDLSKGGFKDVKVLRTYFKIEILYKVFKDCY
jgi:hypothetical protein